MLEKHATIRPPGTGKRKATRTSWRPGVSGNPKGRPPSGSALAEVLRSFLDQPEPSAEGWSRKQLLVAQLWRMSYAKEPSLAAIRLMFEQQGMAELEGRLRRLEDKLLQVLQQGAHDASKIT